MATTGALNVTVKIDRDSIMRVIDQLNNLGEQADAIGKTVAVTREKLNKLYDLFSEAMCCDVVPRRNKGEIGRWYCNTHDSYFIPNKGCEQAVAKADAAVHILNEE